MDIKELALRTVDAMQVYGLTPHTAWDDYTRAYTPIIKMHEAKGEKDFNREIITEYVRQLEGRFERNEISISHYRNLKRAANRLAEVHDTGKLDWSAPKRKSGFRLNEYYENLLAQYISAGKFSPKGTSDATWVSRKYFAWLILEGHADLKGVGAGEIQQFMIYCSHHMKGTGLHNVKLYMKKLYSYLAGNGYATDDYAGLFAFPVSRASRLFPALPPEEIATMLESINRRTPKGKRDYAIILLGVVMGLRAIDIARLRLSDISSLFNAADSLLENGSDDAQIAPVLFRLIYTCGLRPNEGRELEYSNVNLETGEILVTKTKRKKERLVVMSDDMLDLCRKYDEW